MQLQILGARARFPRAHLVDPPPRGYLHLAAVVEPPAGRAPFARTSQKKAALLDRLKSLGRQAESVETVEKVTIYKALVVPPVTGYAKRTGVHHARYDVVALVETSSPEDIGKVQASEAYQALHDALAGAASDMHVMAARCVRSLGDVDKTRQGLFLFNYFVADDAAVALELWDWLAGWYVVETGLDNSTVLAPIGEADYAFVNHARWDYGLPRFLLHQLSKPSFRTYVQANMLANRTGAMPVLYHLA
jgi:hypothetical protein